ncbi:MAG: ATP-binding cassette domain-containing protein [Actinobacteria bacterium]|nr:ATP-binding cassette domain-containing protein [Actinomycetota bacterium]
MEEVHAIDGVTMDISQGEYLVVFGRSGSGKTTLLNLIGCIDKPTSGRVTVHGVETEDLSDRALATLRSTTIGFVFQHFFLIPTLTAVENVMVPGRFCAKNNGNLKERARELLDLVDLGDRADHLPHELSGGEMQRVALARAMMNKPAILLADEPTGNLDTGSAEQIADIFEELNQRGLTIVVVTHSAELSKNATRQVQLRDGRIVDDLRLRPVPSLETMPVPVEEPAVEVELVGVSDGEPVDRDEPETKPVSVPIPEYMPATLKRREFGHPAVAVAMAATGAVMFAAAFMPFIGKFSGFGLIDQGWFVVSLHRGGNLTRTFVGKPALIFTGTWPIILGALLIAAGFAFLINRQRLARWSAIFIGVLATTLAVISILTIGSRLGSEITVRSGYWVFLGAGVASLVLGVFLVELQRLRKRAPERQA